MNRGGGSLVDECDPQQAWDALQADGSARLVDVRTRPEWSFVGIPDLSPLGRQAILTEWRVFPDMQINSRFAEALVAELGDDTPSHIYFLCRSGARSMEAARTVSAHYAEQGIDMPCTNVAEGFEGDLDENRHRGSRNGWKARGLSWRQS